MSDEPTPTQRDMMRSLFKAHGGDKDAVIAAYAKAEREGRVLRLKNTIKYNADQYATEMWRDGIKKGWLA
ncbi:hypothetical protein [Methylobacterium sp. Leaf91]|uniref:hypothetical protein n=1 Tax=Methylobacterium sp. Leaf91 TaxID=1736247 RepID=UPI0006F490FC|nr:hypothetical protein [Methylobacterium sp. Leaf91]KQP00293.1 hypothetical protein ASF32_13730 [Methylobacterium sp. Leaf91]